MEHKQILIVTNSMTEEEVSHIKNAISTESAQKMKINVSLVHIVPHLPTCYFNIPTMGMLVEKYYEDAKHSLQKVGQHLHIPKKDQWLISGKIRTEVLRLANRLGSNFILAGSSQIQELQRSLFFKNIHQYALIKNINQFKQL